MEQKAGKNEDRKQWRPISRRITTLTITDNNGARRLFWFEEPEGFRPEEGGLPAGVISCMDRSAPRPKSANTYGLRYLVRNAR